MKIEKRFFSLHFSMSYTAYAMQVNLLNTYRFILPSYNLIFKK